MFGNARRKTGGPNFATGRPSTAITPTKRITDLGAAQSVRKNDSRMSFGPSAHRTSLFQRAGPHSKDMKACFAANVAKIYHFFVETEGSEAPPEKMIRSPTKNEFITIFELVYQHLSKDYEFHMQNRLEEEFTSILKALGYPYPLKNSFFQPIGSSHGYPNLVDALAWLVEVVEVNSAVSRVTQNILIGDFMEPELAEDKVLSYSWFSKTFLEFTNNRKALEDKSDPFWESTRLGLREYFERNDETAEMIASCKNTLEQMRFDCEEIEEDKGNEQSLLDEISRLRDDVRKAEAYLLETSRALEQATQEHESVKEAVETKGAEFEQVKMEVARVKELIEQQKEQHGLTGKEVRAMNVECQRDKETVSEIQMELDKVSKVIWRLRDAGSFKEQKSRFDRLIEHMHTILVDADIHLELEPICSPSTEIELRAGWEAINGVWLPEVNRQLQHKKLELEAENARFSSKFGVVEEKAILEQELLNEAIKQEARDERVRRNEREEWKASRLQKEQRCDELENEQDVLVKQLNLDGNLDAEIREAAQKAERLFLELQAKKEQFEGAVRAKIDEMMESTVAMEQEKLMLHKECSELESSVKSTL